MGALSTVSTADRDALLEYWAQLYDLPAPQISTVMLRQALGHKIQEQHYGGLKPAMRRFLENEAAGINTVAPVLPKPGTRLIRQWRGVTYEVIIIPNGVLLDGVHMSSLTKAAEKITGTKRSGPLFFGLVKEGRHGRS